MDKTTGTLGAAVIAVGEILTPDPSYGQLPFYSGTSPGPYAIEGRHYADPENGLSLTYVTKAFPEIGGAKVWGYAGTSSKNGGVFWGAGPRFEYAVKENLKIGGEISLDGNAGKVTGVTSYNTVMYKDFFLDLHPGLHKDAKGDLTPDFHVNLGKRFDMGNLGKMSIGLTGGMDGQSKPRDAYARAVFSKARGNFVDFGIGYSIQGKMPLARISVQRTFGDSRSGKGGKG